MKFYRSLVRPALFRLEPETAHSLAVRSCQLAGHIPILPQLFGRSWQYQDAALRVSVPGLTLENPVGLAAGWDKSGQTIELLGRLGFGFAEIGSISARPSIGNPKPRLFRLPQDHAIVVNYGLPNDGAEVVSKRLTRSRPRIPIGVNLVKTNDGADSGPCSDDEIYRDYVQSVQLLHSDASYLTLNLSCPNAIGGKEFFSEPGKIAELLVRLADTPLDCPVYLKVAPDPSPHAMDRVLSETSEHDFVHGFMFNLPPGKPKTVPLSTSPKVYESMPGAVAGRPVASLINHCIEEMYQRMPRDRFIIIGGGGVFTAEDAYEKIRLGASLVQIYTGLIYEGPTIVGRINRGLVELLQRDGLSHITEAVGVGHDQ